MFTIYLLFNNNILCVQNFLMILYSEKQEFFKTIENRDSNFFISRQNSMLVPFVINPSDTTASLL